MTRRIAKLALLAFVAAGVSACKGNNNKSPDPAPPSGVVPPPAAPPPSGGVAGMLGAGFAAIFGASANTEPKDPAPGDLNPVALDKEPVNF